MCSTGISGFDLVRHREREGETRWLFAKSHPTFDFPQISGYPCIKSGYPDIGVFMSTPPTVEASRCNCGALRKASRRISQFYDLALAPCGLKSTQFAMLTEIDRC